MIWIVSTITKYYKCNWHYFGILQRIRFCCLTARRLLLFRWSSSSLSSQHMCGCLFLHASPSLWIKYILNRLNTVTLFNCFKINWACLASLLCRPTSKCVDYRCRWCAEQMLNTCHLLVSKHAATEATFVLSDPSTDVFSLSLTEIHSFV